VLNNFVAPTPQEGQEDYVKSIRGNVVTICTGLAGTGKTYLALAEAIEMVRRSSKRGGIQRIVVIRPYIPSNTGEKIGALPGTLDEKVTPYVQSVRDNLRQFGLSEQEIQQLIAQKFEFTVLSMCRGRSFNNCFVIVEEAQNVPLNGDAMKMVLTRVGKHCKMVIAGDLDQCDIDPRDSALTQAINVLNPLPTVGIVEMDNVETIQRSAIVRDIIKAYRDFEQHYG
jgi:phosphate starvation-inducible protein PhoH and related proteins